MPTDTITDTDNRVSGTIPKEPLKNPSLDFSIPGFVCGTSLC